MARTPVIAVIDIGKTNKKLFLFDRDYNKVHETSTRLAEVRDEDDFPCESIEALTTFVYECLTTIFSLAEFELKAINFSTYGASFALLDNANRPVAPIYNYLKPYPDVLRNEFYSRYGGETKFCFTTASPSLGNLNSGLQLFRLKVEKPEIFSAIAVALHLPQFISNTVCGFTGTDITSIGCHTALWDFQKNRYHKWVTEEGLASKLPALFPSDHIVKTESRKGSFLSGIGLHDSSAALIPYLLNFDTPFLLISTGTWCVSMNPFNQSPLTEEELLQDSLCYLSYDSKPVKASRIFAGNEHEVQVKRIAAHFHQKEYFFRDIELDLELVEKLFSDLVTKPGRVERESQFHMRDLQSFDDPKVAYHQLMIDIAVLQKASSELVILNSPVKQIFIDGGFSENMLYMYLLSRLFPSQEIYAASLPQASALGAAMVIHNHWNEKPLPQGTIGLKKISR